MLDLLPTFLIAGLALAQPATPGAAAAVPAASAAEADRLYFHRHQGTNLADDISFLEAQLKADPEQPAWLWRLGRALVRLGERQAAKSDKLATYTRAVVFLNRAVSLAPREPQAHYWLGLALGRRGQVRGVLRSLFLVGPLRQEMRTVLELDPNNGGAHHVLGEMLLAIPIFAGGSKKQAVRELETAAVLEPDSSAHFTALAEAYLAVGERGQARAALERVFSIRRPSDPGEYDDDVQEARDMLKRIARR